MSASLLLYSSFSVLVDGVLHEGGDRVNPAKISLDGEVLDLRKSLATATTWDAWAAGSEEPLDDFDFLWIESDYDVFVELTIDQNAGVGREEIAIEVKANVPFVLASNVGKALYTADFAVGTDDVIDQIRIRNESGETASVRLFLAS